MNQTVPGQQKQTIWHPNRNYINLNNNIIVDSCFPSGNVYSATIIKDNPLTIQLQGNTDVANDSNAKYWLYFRIRGYRKDRPIKFVLKNANHLRKYYGQNRYRPYMMYREGEEQWQSCSAPIDIVILQNGHYQGSFTFQSEKASKITRSNRSTNDLYPPKQEKVLTSTTTGKQDSKSDCYFAITQPYTFQDLTSFIQKQKLKHRQNSTSKTYFHEQILTYSFHRRKIQLITITSVNNIESVSEKQPCISQEIFPFPKERPHKLKNNPIIFVSARVHPSETSSSFFAQGLIQYLLSDCKSASILRQLFIIQVIPMLNPDGVQHGNFRFDHQLRNLNRYYGQSSISKTPSIRAAQLLIQYYKNRSNQQCQFTQFYQQTYSRMFMYIDVHGHSSAIPSFLYGNHSDKIEYLIENKMLCKLMQSNFVNGGFSKLESEFSKKNMTVQEKYDEFSKLCAGRVFAGRADTPEQSVFHSYTLQILPYWEEFPKRKGQPKQKITATEYSKMMGKDIMLSLLDLLDLNPQSKFSDTQMQRLRKNIAKQCFNEQLRKVFLFKKAEGSQRCSYSQISKNRQNIAEKDYPYQNQYILRWFNNQVYLKHLMEKTFLLKQPKCLKFYQKIAKIMQFPGKQLLQSPRKEVKQVKSRQGQLQQKPPELKVRFCNSSSKVEQESPTLQSKNRCFIPRQQKKTIGNQQKLMLINRMREKTDQRQQKSIAKHTLQLRQEQLDIITKTRQFQKESYFYGQKLQKKQLQKNVQKRQTIYSTDRYEKEIIQKINTQNNNCYKHNMFQIRIKQIKPKPKSNVRFNTQNNGGGDVGTINCQNQKIKNSSSQVNHFCVGKNIPPEDFKVFQRPSFIQEFIMKIREEREAVATGKQTIKCTHKDQVRNKIMKYRPSLKDQLEQPDKNLLPVLRRNKIFTIASETTAKESPQQKPYDTVLQNKKRANTIQSQSHLNEGMSKGHKIMTVTKIQQKSKEIRQVKKSQKIKDTL